jgi:hypothetical protein
VRYFTVSETPAACDILPVVARNVRGKVVPCRERLEAESVTVALAVPVTAIVDGLMEQIEPVGAPLQLSTT